MITEQQATTVYQFDSYIMWPVWNYSGPLGITEGLIFDRPPVDIEVLEREFDLEPLIVKIRNTGDSSDPVAERYRHTIDHNLKRVPTGCIIQWADELINVKVAESDTNKITVVFDVARAEVNLRIW